MNRLFECSATFVGSGRGEYELHLAMIEFNVLPDEYSHLHGITSMREGEAESVILTIEAEDENAASEFAQQLFDRIETDVRKSLGAGQISRQEIETIELDSPSVADQLVNAQWLEQVGAMLAPRASDAPAEPIADAYTVMQDVGLNGGTHDITTEDIIAWFRAHETTARFHFDSIGRDHASLVFDELPADVEVFAAEAYEICPDLEEIDELDLDDDDLEEEATVQGIARNIREHHRLNFWWD